MRYAFNDPDDGQDHIYFYWILYGIWGEYQFQSVCMCVVVSVCVMVIPVR